MKTNLKHSSVELNHLPDKILIYILKKLSNVEVLYSLIDVHTIAHDRVFINYLKLMKCILDESIDSLPKSIVDRFCLQILPEIHHQIKWLDLEASSMKRILFATNYPHLYGLGLYDIAIETVLSLFNGKIFFSILLNN
jgi:hypothetical protein